MSGKDEDMRKKLERLSNLEIHTIGALMQFAKKNGVVVDTEDMEALNKITNDTLLNYETLTDEQKNTINEIYRKLYESKMGGYKKTKKRRRKRNKKLRKKTIKKRKKKRNSRRKYRKRKRKTKRRR